MPPTMRRLYPNLPDELKQWAGPDYFIGHCTKVSDGDTIHARIQLGFGVELPNVRIRLLGIDAPELVGANKQQGQNSRTQLHRLLHNEWIGVQTYADQCCKYGRELAIVWHYREAQLININQWMLDNNLAKPLKVNRFFDGRSVHCPALHPRCEKCNSFILPTLGNQPLAKQTNE